MWPNRIDIWFRAPEPKLRAAHVQEPGRSEEGFVFIRARYGASLVFPPGNTRLEAL